MKKMILKINKDEDFLYPCDGYILGIDNFCICFSKTFLVDDVIKIKKKYDDKKIFVSLNRVIFNSELSTYKSILKKLDKIGLDGIIVGDVSSLTYDLKTPIILDQMHLNNSSLSIKHYHDNGVCGIVLSNDITLQEINKIKDNNKDVIMFKQVFGMPHLSTSVRKLVSNYFEHFNKKTDGKVFKIKENNSTISYTIFEDYFGSHILSNNPINLIDKLNLLNVDYFIFDGFLLEDYKWVLKAFINNDINLKNKIDDAFNSNEGFIDRKTIYKVKNND